MQKEIDRLLSLLDQDKAELEMWRNKFLEE